MTHGVGRTAGAMIQQALLGEALESAPALGAFVLDDDGRYVAVNAAACELAGYSREELVGRAIGSFNPHVAEEYAAVRAGRRSGTTWIDRGDGSRVTIEYRASETRVARMPFLLVVCWPAAS